MLCKVPETISFKLTGDQNSYIKTMANEIYNCPVRSQGRSLELIELVTRKGVILEYALCEQGATKNNAPFDVTNRDSYSWDVMWDGLKTEVKNMRITSEMSWVSFKYNSVKTFIKNVSISKDLVDIIIMGCYNEASDGVITASWRLIAPADTFAKNVRKCNPIYTNNYDVHTGELKYFYNHKGERRCILINAR